MNPQQNSSPDSSSEEFPPDPSPRSRFPWLRSLLILILLGAGGGVAYGWYFIYNRLSPTVAEALTNLLARPVEMGEVETFSLTSLTFGETVVSPQDDKSEAVIIPAVEVDFTPLKLLTQQTIELDVTLVEPEISIEQTVAGKWITTELNEQPPGAIEIKLKTLTVEEASLAVAPRNPAGELQPPVNLTLPELQSQFFDNNQRILFQLRNLSVADAQGSLDLKGEARLKSGEVDVAVTTNQLAIGELARLVSSPLNLKGGTVDIDSQVTLSFDGSFPTFDGTAQLNQVEGTLDQFTTAIKNTNADLRLARQDIIIEDLTTQFGDINASAQGAINLANGYDLQANIEPTAVSSLLSAVDIDPSDIPISGTIAAQVTITGALDNPQLDITANSTETTTVDQVKLSGFQTELAVQGTEVVIEEFQATPEAGGEIAVQGTLNLTAQQEIALNVELKDVPGEVIRPYQENLPEDLGTLNASGAITGALSEWNRLKGEGTANLAIADGTVTLSKFNLAEGRLQAQIDINALQPEQLSPDVPPQLQNPLSGQFRLDAD